MTSLPVLADIFLIGDHCVDVSSSDCEPVPDTHAELNAIVPKLCADGGVGDPHEAFPHGDGAGGRITGSVRSFEDEVSLLNDNHAISLGRELIWSYSIEGACKPR